MILWGFSIFNKQQISSHKWKEHQDNPVQCSIAYQCLDYMRITAITDEHVNSRFALTEMEIADAQRFHHLLVFLDYLTFYTPQKMNWRYAWQNEIQVIFIKTGFSQSGKHKIHIKWRKKNRGGWQTMWGKGRGVKSFMWRHHFCMSFCLVLWPLKGNMHHTSSVWLDVPLRATA